MKTVSNKKLDLLCAVPNIGFNPSRDTIRDTLSITGSSQCSRLLQRGYMLIPLVSESRDSLLPYQVKKLIISLPGYYLELKYLPCLIKDNSLEIIGIPPGKILMFRLNFHNDQVPGANLLLFSFPDSSHKIGCRHQDKIVFATKTGELRRFNNDLIKLIGIII